MSKTSLPTHAAASADGTTIAYEVRGDGPALVLVDGALCRRDMGPSRGFAEALADRFTVYTYDRRGRGESSAGTGSWAVEREVEDLAAVIEAAGGRACLLGTSSGAALALEAAR
ncbi:MAG: alpha/beta fold hydrolase, partial [Trebonia sp.]